LDQFLLGKAFARFGVLAMTDLPPKLIALFLRLVPAFEPEDATHPS
jgi:hypothetical protein